MTNTTRSILVVMLLSASRAMRPNRLCANRRCGRPDKVYALNVCRLIVFLLGVVGPGVAAGGDLPTTGTFEGVYHRDPWGVGHFAFFVVHPDLHKQLGAHEGRRVRVEVTQGEQPVNPGPAIMLAVERIKALPKPPLAIRVRTGPEVLTAGQPFQLIVEVENTSTDGSLLYPSVGARLRQPLRYTGQRPDEPYALLPSYTVGQLSVSNRFIQLGGWEMLHAAVNFNGRGGQLLLSPGASYVWTAQFPQGIAPGNGEFRVAVGYVLAEPDAPFGVWKSPDRTDHEAWHVFCVGQKMARGAPVAKATRLLEASSLKLNTEDDGWLHFHRATDGGRTTGNLVVPGDKPNRLASPLPNHTGADARDFSLDRRLGGVARTAGGKVSSDCRCAAATGSQ